MPRRAISIVSVEAALKMYYTKTEIDTTDIKALFGISSGTTVSRLRALARAVMKEEGAKCWNANALDTECAFKAWNIDIERLERSHSKLKRLKIEESNIA